MEGPRVARPPRAAARDLRRRLRVLPRVDRALAGRHRDRAWITRPPRQVAARFPEIPEEAFRARAPARSARRPGARGRRGGLRDPGEPVRAGALLARATRGCRASRPSRELAYRFVASHAARPRAARRGFSGDAHVDEAAPTSARRPSSCASSVSAISRRSSRSGSRWTGSSARAGSCRSRRYLEWVRAQTGAERYCARCRRCAGSRRATRFLHFSAQPARPRASSSRPDSFPPCAAGAAWALYLSLCGRGPGLPRVPVGRPPARERACSRFSSSRSARASASAPVSPASPVVLCSCAGFSSA